MLILIRKINILFMASGEEISDSLVYQNNTHLVKQDSIEFVRQYCTKFIKPNSIHLDCRPMYHTVRQQYRTQQTR